MTMFMRGGAACVARLDPIEAEVLHQMFTEVVAMVSDGTDRADPVVARLFPDVYPADAQMSAELHRYVDDDLRAAKLEQAGLVLGALPRGGGTVRLDDEQAEAWLRALTDARLALGLRLGVRDDTDMVGELDDAVLRDPTSARVRLLSIYDFLTLLQASLVDALAGE